MLKHVITTAVVGTLAVAPAVADPPHHRRDPQVTMVASKGRLGVSILAISSELRGFFGAPGDRGVLVDSVLADSPAAKAGLKVGDVIVEVDGDPTRSAADIIGALADKKKGQTVGVVVVRDKKTAPLTALLTEDPSPFPPNLQVEPWTFDGNLRRDLDDARRRIDELERKLDKLRVN